MTSRQLAHCYFLVSGCFWASLISVHGFLVVTAQDHLGLPQGMATVPLIVVHCAVVALEIPTGALADSWSRARSAAAGQVLVALSLLSIPFLGDSRGAATSFGIVAFAGVFATGWALFSGSLKGLVSKHIRENDPDLMPWFVRMGSGWNNAAILVVTILYPVLYGLQWRAVWFAAGGLAFCSLLFSLPLVRHERTTTTSSRSSAFASLRMGLNSFVISPRLLEFSLVSVVLFALATTFESTLQAHAATLAEKESALVGTPASPWRFLDFAWFAWFFLTVGSLLATRWSLKDFTAMKALSEASRTLTGLGLVTALLMACALIPLFESGSSIHSVIFAGLSFALGWLLTALRNDNSAQLQSAIVEGQVTSTVMSINSLFQDLLSAAFLGVFMLPFISRAGYPPGWVVLGIFSIIAVFIVPSLVARTRIRGVGL